MKKNIHKIIGIVGPTTSGKSNLAIYLARKFGGEVISIDSRQVYRNMDIGTAKVFGKIDQNQSLKIILGGQEKNLHPYISEKVNHWLIDVVDPEKDVFNVAEFQDMAYQIIFSLFSQNKLPILAGGSALYMDAILEGYIFPKTSPRLRDELERFSTNELLDQLKKSDSNSYEKIDHKNRRRILRALEAFLLNKRSLKKYLKKKPNFDYLIIGLNWPRKILYERIDKKIDQRIKQGMIKEIKNLLKKKISSIKLQNFGLEYRFITKYLNGELSLEDATQQLKYKSHAFARRQLSWWRRNKKIKWFMFHDIADKEKNYQKAEELVRRFLKK